MKMQTTRVFAFLLFLCGCSKGEPGVGPNANAPAPSEPGKAATDWPQWLGPARNGVSAETGLLAEWPKDGPKQLWRVTGGGGFSSCAVSGGRLFTLIGRNGDELVLCLDAADGKEIWKVRSDADRPDGFGDGPRSTPTVDGDRVYTLGASGALLCLDVKTGKEIWKANILKDFSVENLRWGVSSSPLVEGDLLLTMVGGDNASAVAFDKATGKVVWKALGDAAAYAAPIAITVGGVRQVVFFHAGGLAGLSPKDGAVHWQLPWKTDFDCNIATPLWSEKDGLLFISSGYDRGCAAVKLTAAGGKVAAEKVWENRVLKNHQATSILLDGKVYGFDGQGPATLKCIDLKTGRAAWVNRSVGKGSLVAADGHLYVLSEQGEMALVAADPASYNEKSRFQPLSGTCWSVPVIAGGRLYVRNEKDILCYRVAK